ncbi:MAG: relaxase domain-containing protein, partial [Alphaproteobacteria bacterium]|nr:relaxase domain-containing protein [Alphaproteobacteria bacterium]
MVAKVNRLGSAAASVHYFEREGGYYARNDPEHRRASRWHGAGAVAAGLKGRVDAKRFRSVLEGQVPKTDIRLGRRTREGETEHEPGHDITFSAPKSVSLEGLLWGREEVVRAHDGAVRATLDFIEARLLETRVWDREFRRMRRAPAPSMVAATFRHIASRDLDPQLHTHAVIANMTRDAEGRWRSLDAGRLKAAEKLIGAHYRNELARRLIERGYTLSPSMAGGVPSFEIAGYGRAELSAFSNRRLAILRYVKERGWNYNAARAQQAALATRARKNEPGRAALEELWRGRAKELGFVRPRKRRTQQQPVLSMLEIALRAAAHLEERRSVFPAHDLTMLCLAHSPGRYTLREADEAIAQLVRDGHLLETVRRGVSGRAFVTDRAVRAERGMLALLREGAGAGGPLTEAAPVEARLAASFLTDGQKQAVRTVLLHDDLVVGVQGYAGTGKTTMLKEVAELSGDRRVFGLAPSAVAARVLGREAGIPVRTLQWFLARYRDVGDNLLDDRALAELRKRFQGSILVADEMSMASTAQTLALMRIASRLGVGRLMLVGDRKQLRAVEAGQPFRQLQEAGMATALMDDIRRQRDPDLKAAVLEAVAGEPRRALDRLGGNVVELPAEELAETAAQLWLRLPPEARRETLLLAPTHELRRRIVAAVREGLEEEGVLHGRVLEIETLSKLHMTRTETGDIRNWREGDVAVFQRDIYPYRLRAGDACTVTGFEGDRVLLEHPDGRARRIRPAGEIRYRLDLHETQTIAIRAGDRIRWTRNDKLRGLDNGAVAEILSIGRRKLKLRTEDGRTLEWRHDDPQLRHILHAWASTVHAAQGTTRDRVIAVADAGHGHLGGLQSFYVQISRARDNAVVLTDDRESLAAALEADDGDRLTALEALGEDIALPEEETAERAPVRVPKKLPAAPSLKPETREESARAGLPGPDSLARTRNPELRFAAWRSRKARHAREAAEAGTHPALHAGHDGLLSELRALAQDDGLAPGTQAAVGEELARLGREADAGRLDACMEGLRLGLEARVGLEGDAEGNAVVDHADYARWRRELETAATAGRGLLGNDRLPDLSDGEGRAELEAMLGRAEGLLAGDDGVFRARTAAGRLGDWLDRWTDAIERIEGR